MQPGGLDNRVWSDAGAVTWRELRAGLATRVDPQALAPLACATDDPREALAWVALAMQRDQGLCVLGRERLTAAVREALLAAGLALPGAEVATPAAPGSVWILTSGSTGVPKLIRHSWASLLTVRAAAEPRRWLLPFQVGTYAWYQLVMPSLCLAGQDLVVPPAGADVAAILQAGLRHGADAIASTPTLWRVARMTLGDAALRALPLRQITLGGESVDQAILDELRALYPNARLSHIYAATEVGACIVVHDGRQGFPAAWLGAADREFQLQARDGVLWVRSPKRGLNDGLAEADGWVCTGDLIERSGDRVLFRGRAGRQLINVGGQKAYPAEVEDVLLAHPWVAWCRVSARRAPLVGSLVSAAVVLRAEVPADEAEAALVAHCRAHLAEYAIPRFFERLAAIPTAGNLKSSL